MQFLPALGKQLDLHFRFSLSKRQTGLERRSDCFHVYFPAVLSNRHLLVARRSRLQTNAFLIVFFFGERVKKGTA